MSSVTADAVATPRLGGRTRVETLVPLLAAYFVLAELGKLVLRRFMHATE